MRNENGISNRNGLPRRIDDIASARVTWTTGGQPSWLIQGKSVLNRGIESR
jgi:hypothetical protein